MTTENEEVVEQQAPSANLHGPGPAGPPLTKNTVVMPLAVNIEKVEDYWQFEFLINPMEILTVKFNDEARQGIIRELSPSIAVATAADIAKLR